ncbi:VWA domain-containing protein [Gordonia sp. PDNC005]|uniref:vWA domain-containing protein n=1 Tax=unclassified Gordonia (in: high G+C Gram-positive bacteria) TaxID=2657482 RepID=UPI0019629CBF|nr:VWA domain-containing protein [Gordonia sp. PDNC005]QRY61088.1 VWA domain-containing protein [Gordonia sp. PDNC005]
MPQSLTRGQNASLSSGATRLTIDVSGASVDILAFQLDANRKVRSDTDFVFFNQPRSPEGAVTLDGPTRLSVHLPSVPADVSRIAIAVAADTALSSTELTTTIRSDDGAVVTAPAEGLTTEQAAILVEVYRRGGAWKVRSESAGWTAGFAALVRELGVTVDEEPAPAPTIRMVKGEETLSLEKRQTLNLRKEAVHKVLLTKGAAGATARVIMVIDKTGSMSSLYRRGTVRRAVERMVPVATQLDSDGDLEAYLYAKSYVKLPNVTVATADLWIDTFVHLSGTHGAPITTPIDYKRIGAVNEELPIMQGILDDLPDRQPVLVLFFTDGGFYSKIPLIRNLIGGAATRPVFWQFIGLGKNNFGVLTELDTLAGRVVDNAGFFQIDDLDRISDADLYDRLLGEFPDWLRAAGAAGIID